ncbi:MAG: glycosyltransferase [Bacillota bacterium]|nr:glycosyltransferase [Bacillota bacterium]
MKKIRISLCMIVKDEEEYIACCLNSVKDVVDEMIIVDTGSTDHTIEICQSFKCQIEKFTWNGSFADARNFGLKKATGDWILWLDADEELDEKDKWKLFEGEHFEHFDILSLYFINYHGNQVDVNDSTSTSLHRLFRNSGFTFKNKIHECLDFDHIPKERIGHLHVKVHHYGYLNSTVEKKGKTDRNLKLLKEQIKEGENVPWAYYFIALEYYNKQQFQEALNHLNLSILSFLSKKVLPPSAIYKLKYFIYIAMERFKEALPGIEKAMILYPDFVDLQFYHGVILYHLEKYKAAIQCFKKCMEMGEENPNHLILKGVGSFQAWYYISLCQLKLGKKKDAAISVARSLLLAPNYKEAREIFAQLFAEDEKEVLEWMESHFKEEELEKIIRKG